MTIKIKSGQIWRDKGPHSYTVEIMEKIVGSSRWKNKLIDPGTLGIAYKTGHVQSYYEETLKKSFELLPTSSIT